MKNLVFLFLSFCLSSTSNGQAQTRYLKDKLTLQAIPYATIKVLHSSRGVIANQEGIFELEIKGADSIQISSAGYRATVFAGSEMDSVLYLETSIYTLKELVVTSKTPIGSILLGNGAGFIDKEIKCKNFNPETNNDCWPWIFGSSKTEFAEKIVLPSNDHFYRVTKLFFPVNKFSCWHPLMVRIYSEDSSTGLPGNELYTKPVYVSKNMIKNGKVVLDLNAENIVFNKEGSFFISLGWMEDQGYKNCKTLTTLVKSDKANTFSRNLASYNFKWVKEWMIGSSKENSFFRNTMFAVQLDVLN